MAPMNLTKNQRIIFGGGAALLVGLHLIKSRLDSVSVTAQTAAAASQAEAQQAINDAVAAATNPPAAVAGFGGLGIMDGLGYAARQRSIHAMLAGLGRVRRNPVIAGLGLMPVTGKAWTGAHHPPGRVFQADQPAPFKRVSYDSPLNYPILDGVDRSGALPGMGSYLRHDQLAGCSGGALPGMGADPIGVDAAIAQAQSVIGSGITFAEAALALGLCWYGYKAVTTH